MEAGVSPTAVQGTTNYGTSGRAGDFSSTVVDPSDNLTFWSTNQFKGAGTWNTGFANFSLGGQTGTTQYSLTSSDDPVTAGAPFSITVSALDFNGQVDPTYQGTVHFSSTDGQASLPGDYTFTAADNGVHTFNNVALGTAGDQTITANDTANGSITGTVDVTVTPAPAVQFSVVTDAADPDVAGSVFDVTVTAQDSFGNTDINYTGTVTFSSGDPFGATLPADYTFQPSDQGQVTFTGMTALYTAGTWDVTATDTVSGITGSAFVNVQAAPAVMLAVIAPSSASSGAAFDVTVVAQDPYGNTDTNYGGTVTWTSTDQDPNVQLPSDYQFQPSDDGQVTFPGGVTLISLGNQAITATDTVSGITGSATVAVTTAPVAGLGGNSGNTTSPTHVAAHPASASPATVQALDAVYAAIQPTRHATLGTGVRLTLPAAHPLDLLDDWTTL
jgi:hypothetical protein